MSSSSPSRRSGVPLVALLASLIALPAAAQPLVIEIFELRFRPVDQVLAIVTPLVPRPGTVSGIQNQLIVRSTLHNLAEIRQILERIDVRPRNLLISVRQDADATRGGSGFEISGSAPVGESGRVTVGGTDPRALRGDGIGARVFSTQQAANDRVAQQVRAIEGQPAHIRIGEQIPVPVRQVVRGPFGTTQVIDGVQIQELATGFEVLVRTSGDQVVIEIAPRRDTPGRFGPGSAEVQRLVTTVSGRLGEWIDIGGATRHIEQQDTVLLGRTGGMASDQRRVSLRVDEVR
jgi:hypothetical protein